MPGPSIETPGIDKAATGIPGLDAITLGGLPRGRVTLIEGGPGAGKTVLALQTLVNATTRFAEPAIFVAFEESSERIIANTASFGWNLQARCRESLFFLDARPAPGLVQSGGFDLGGLLAALAAKTKQMGARRIVFDALDMVLARFERRQDARQETYRLHEWLLTQEFTAILTAKASPRSDGPMVEMLEFLQFMVDCSIVLANDVVDGTARRSIRISKYRGSLFKENTTPLSIRQHGIDVANVQPLESSPVMAPLERLSSGVVRLDTMLAGGYYRGAGVLLTGSPGTAKTTLAGAFAQAACARGEATLFISFDSPADEVVRNLASVGIELVSHLTSGVLRLEAARVISSSAEIHLLRIREIAAEHGARCVVIDPLSALTKAGSHTAVDVVERLIHWAKTEGITLLCTSLLDGRQPDVEATPLQISTMADTWIHLSYMIQAGERNRALSIIKSRGSSHSNQVRELLLDDDGITLADVYTSSGEVVMGAMRWERERAERLARAERDAAAARQRLQLEAEALELEGRLQALRHELDAKRASLAGLIEATRQVASEGREGEAELRRIRWGDGRDDAHELRHG